MTRAEKFLEYLRGAWHANPAVLEAKARWLDSVVLDEHGCLIWTGPLQSPRAGDYPMFVYRRSARGAFNWMVENFLPTQWGTPSGWRRFVSCPRTPLCVSPFHRCKGVPTGGPPRKLRDWQVRAIRAADRMEFPASRLAKIHGCSRPVAGKARSGRAYAWVQ